MALGSFEQRLCLGSTLTDSGFQTWVGPGGLCFSSAMWENLTHNRWASTDLEKGHEV